MKAVLAGRGVINIELDEVSKVTLWYMWLEAAQVVTWVREAIARKEQR